MPKRTDISKILVIGSGPIVIGQACEFDYSGTQAIKALKEEGYKVILINSNPATIMTDPELADKTYIEPLNVEFLEKIIIKEKPDAILPTVGGQTALNLALKAHDAGLLKKYDVQLIGVNIDSIKKAEDRALFKEAMQKINLDMPKSFCINSLEAALQVTKELDFPLIMRPSFTMGGTGGGIAYNIEEYQNIVKWGLEASPINEILVEESIIGWKEFELELMRDLNDNVVVICSIENLDPMGTHTGDSITVAPAQTLSDKELQMMRTAGIAVMREIGVDTGGSNVQFAINPETGRMIIIEMNPRVSRSSALASKATGFPIAKIAAKLAVGYSLDELKNDITKTTQAAFEPALDYVVTKVPRFDFEKFPGSKNILDTQMRSVGEAMSIGGSMKESLQKALISLEIGLSGFDEVYPSHKLLEDATIKEIKAKIKIPSSHRILYVAEAIRAGISIEEINEISGIDRWFSGNIQEIVEFETKIKNDLDEDILKEAKQLGFSDIRIGKLSGKSEDDVRGLRKKYKIYPVYKRVDTCAAEFESYTPYLYSTYSRECEADVRNDKEKVIILGGGPNRIGQGIEFDYCCVHASFALHDVGYETIMVNCNPETVSTDYDSSDRLYFEPLTLEHVLNIIDLEKPKKVIVQFGGQTPLKLALKLESLNVPIAGTTADSIDMAEDRERFQALVNDLGLIQPKNGIAFNNQEALEISRDIGFPLVVRPSYVLGGRAMEIVFNENGLKHYVENAVKINSQHPILLDSFLQNAIELDVDAISDGEITILGAIQQHIEEAGVHSGDSACSIPQRTLPEDIIKEIRKQTKALAKQLKIIGLMNIQFAVKDNVIYLLEVNPRASRTIPFVSKSIGEPLAKFAARVMLGEKLEDIGFTQEKTPKYCTVKVPVFSFSKFQSTDPILGPEMKSTGEVMGIDSSFSKAFYKAQIANRNSIPMSGNIFVSISDKYKERFITLADELVSLGFNIYSTSGTSEFLSSRGIKTTSLMKISDGSPNVLDLIKESKINFVINIPDGKRPFLDEQSIRRLVLIFGIPYITNFEAAKASILGMREIRDTKLSVKAMQEYYTI